MAVANSGARYRRLLKMKYWTKPARSKLGQRVWMFVKL